MESTPNAEPPAQKPLKAAGDSSKYIHDKSLLVVRMKPIGKGETDQFKKDSAVNPYQNKEYVGANYDSHSIAFQDLKSKGKLIEYKFPDIVATDDFDNKRVYEETVAQKIPLILDGYSMVLCAYG